MTTPSSPTVAHLLGEAAWLRGVARAMIAPAAVADADDLSQGAFGFERRFGCGRTTSTANGS
jgi:hypothetical protein